MIAVLCAVTAVLSAQATGSISGTVRTPAGTPVRGAEVMVVGPDGTRRTTTDSSGRFEVDNLKPGRYSVHAESQGAKTLQLATVASARPSRVNLVLPITIPVLPPVIVDGGRPPGSTSSAGQSHANVTIFFATDRDRVTLKPLTYSGLRNAANRLSYGQIDVHVPRDHHVGYVERPTWWTFWRESPDKHFVITRAIEQPVDEYFYAMRQLVGLSHRKQALVFIHGFNVSFESAAYRTAQLAYDLNFDGVPILYSWPSEGRLTSYPTDLNNNDWTVGHLKAFLQQVSTMSGAQTVHLIGHSMGNRALSTALSQLADSQAPLPHFNQLALTAPDIDASIFKDLASKFRTLVDRATLYASSKDEALVASKTYQGYQRAGDTQPKVVIVPGVDTIDVSMIDTNLIGHFYYGDNRSVISDLTYVLEGLPPDRRATLQPLRVLDGTYWAFKP